MNKVLVAPLVIAVAVGLGGTTGLSYGAETEAGQSSGAVFQPIGEQTRAWLELQRSGREAGRAQPMSSDVADRVYKRYADSFTHPIPAFYERGEFQGSAGTAR